MIPGLLTGHRGTVAPASSLGSRARSGWPPRGQVVAFSLALAGGLWAGFDTPTLAVEGPPDRAEVPGLIPHPVLEVKSACASTTPGLSPPLVCPKGQARFPELAQAELEFPEIAPEVAPEADPAAPAPPPLDLDPTILEDSPVLRRWLEASPDIADEIRNQPSFRTRLRVGYAQFPSTGQSGGFSAGVEDVFVLSGTGLTASGDYSRSWNGQRESYGAEARYYLLPLGGYVNLAPTVGYRALTTPAYRTDGLNLGFRLIIIPSRGGAADLSISQQWVSPGSADEVGMTAMTLGYAVTPQLRLSSDLQFQNSRFGQDSRWGLFLEWLL